ncbi:hypothetical protein HDU80_010183 [Chytriomyces hyalinus]|nr:hypothetical protein HDU80_010183 [Chytriomyces hyalinus]
MDDVKAQLTNLLADIKNYELALANLRLEIKETADQVERASLKRERDSMYESDWDAVKNLQRRCSDHSNVSMSVAPSMTSVGSSVSKTSASSAISE